MIFYLFFVCFLNCRTIPLRQQRGHKAVNRLLKPVFNLGEYGKKTDFFSTRLNAEHYHYCITWASRLDALCFCLLCLLFYAEPESLLEEKQSQSQDKSLPRPPSRHQQHHTWINYLKKNPPFKSNPVIAFPSQNNMQCFQTTNIITASKSRL